MTRRPRRRRARRTRRARPSAAPCRTGTPEPGSHAQLVQACAAWAARRSGVGVVLPEYVCGTRHGEVADVLALGMSGMSLVIECKVSRADFLADRKKRFRVTPELGAGRYRYFACPPGLLSPADLPERWGLLYVYPSGVVRTVVCPVKAKWTFLARGDTEYDVLYSLARRVQVRGLMDSLRAAPAVMPGVLE